MEEHLLKTLPRQSRTASGGTGTKYQAAVMVGDKEGNVGFGVKVKTIKQIATFGATANGIRSKFQIVRGSWDLENVETVPFCARVRYGGTMVSVKLAPLGVGTSGPPLVKKILQLDGITECLLVTKGKTKERLNLIEALRRVFCKLDV